MASFRVEWKKSTKKDLGKLPASVVARVVAEVALLSENPLPHGVEKLSGTENSCRIRLGDYRVVYNVFREWRLVEVQRVRHRKDVYRY